VAVEHTSGDIFDAQYLDLLQQINDEVFYLPGVDRNRMRSLWTPNVRWIEVTELGFEGDKVIDSDYDGSERALNQLRQNILRSGEVGRLVSDNYRSSIVQAPLIDIDPTSGQPLNYWELSRSLETVLPLRAQHPCPVQRPPPPGTGARLGAGSSTVGQADAGAVDRDRPSGG